jgi:hypothetical protein
MIGPFRIRCKISIEVIGKEKKFEYGKHDKELYKDDFPQGPARCHGTKAIHIKMDNPFWVRSGHFFPPTELQYLFIRKYKRVVG